MPPVMLRLRTRRGVVEGPVEMKATWLPSGKTTTWTTTAAQGLCIVPWREGREVSLSMDHAFGAAQVALHLRDVSHLAEEVWLPDTAA